MKPSIRTPLVTKGTQRDLLGQQFYNRFNCFTADKYLRAIISQEGKSERSRITPAIPSDKFENIIKKHFRAFVECNRLHLKPSGLLHSNRLHYGIERMRNPMEPSWVDIAAREKFRAYFENSRELHLFYDLLVELNAFYRKEKTLTESQVEKIAKHFLTQVCLQQDQRVKSAGEEKSRIKADPVFVRAGFPDIIPNYFPKGMRGLIIFSDDKFSSEKSPVELELSPCKHSRY